MPPLPGIQYKTGTTELGGGGTSTEVNPFAINSQTLAPQTSFNYTSPQQVPVYPVSGLNTADLTPQEGKAATLSDQLQQFNDQLLGESQYRSQLEQQQGLPELQKTQSDLTARLNTLKNEALAIPLQLQNESQGLGRTTGGLQPLQTAALRNNAIQSLSTASLLEASRGNITLAQDLVDRAVAQRYDPIREQINAATKNLELILNDPRTSLQDKNRANAQKAIQDHKAAELERAQTAEKAKSVIALDVASRGGSAQLLRDIQEAPDAITAEYLAAQAGFGQITEDGGFTLSEGAARYDSQGNLIAENAKGGGGNGGGSKELLAGLTPAQQADPFIQKLAASEGGKPITDTFAQSLNKGLSVLGQIGGLQTNIENTNTGPIVGLFRGKNPWDNNAQTIKAQLNAIVPNLARGVYGEVGVLTDNDVKQYSKTLPNLSSTEAVRNAVLGITVDLIGKSIKRTLEINAANGKDVSKFIDIYTEMQNTRDSIFSQIPGYKGEGSKSLAEMGISQEDENLFDSTVSGSTPSTGGGFFSDIWKGLTGQ